MREIWPSNRTTGFSTIHAVSLVVSLLLLLPGCAPQPASLDRANTESQFARGLRAAAAGDTSAALSSYRRAAEHGHVDAQYQLGRLYLAGDTIPRDPAEAARWFLLAAEHGSAHAQASIAFMYSIGYGIPLDNLRAYAWSQVAAAQGHELSRTLQASIRRKMTPEQIARAHDLSVTLSYQISSR